MNLSIESTIGPLFMGIKTFLRIVRSINEHAGVESFSSFERRQQPQVLIIVSAAFMQSRAFQITEIVAQDQIEEIVVVCGGHCREFARVTSLSEIFASEPGQQI